MNASPASSRLHVSRVVKDSGHPLLVAAVILAMLAVAVLGYGWLPKADVRLAPVEDCRLDQGPCAAGLPGGGRIEVALAPRPIPSSRPLAATVAVAGVEVDRVELEFTGVAMNMGRIRLPLAAQGAGRYAGNISLPVCVTGAMAWQATVLVETGRQVISVPFRFESRNG
jgi:hypothetical protein